MATARSGQITVTTAGTAVVGPNTGPGTFVLKPVSANSGTYMYVGNDGSDDVASGTGFDLKKDLDKIMLTVSNLNQWYFDTDTNGDKMSYIKVLGDHGLNPPAL